MDTVQPFELDSTNVCQEHWLILKQDLSDEEFKKEFYRTINHDVLLVE